MKVRFTKLDPRATTPTKAHATDAGFDLTAIDKNYDTDGNIVYHTGIAVEIPAGYVGFLMPRSSNAKRKLILSNGVGCVDSGYIGDLTLKFKKIDTYTTTYKGHQPEWNVGDRIAQLVILPIPEIELVEVDKLDDTERGTGGYGSSGTK